jgi:hypothetical protein
MDSDDIEHTQKLIEVYRKMICSNAKMVMVHTKAFMANLEGKLLIINKNKKKILERLIEIIDHDSQLHDLNIQERNANNSEGAQNDNEGTLKKRVLLERMIQGNRGNSCINKLLIQASRCIE